jgi:hypothetical protein
VAGFAQQLALLQFFSYTVFSPRPDTMRSFCRAVYVVKLKSLFGTTFYAFTAVLFYESASSAAVISALTCFLFFWVFIGHMLSPRQRNSQENLVAARLSRVKQLGAARPYRGRGFISEIPSLPHLSAQIYTRAAKPSPCRTVTPPPSLITLRAAMKPTPPS